MDEITGAPGPARELLDWLVEQVDLLRGHRHAPVAQVTAGYRWLNEEISQALAERALASHHR